MDFQGNVHNRVNQTLIPLSSALFGAKDVNILLGESAEIVNGAHREQLLPANSKERRKVMSDSKFQGPWTTPLHHAGNKFNEVIQSKKGGFADLPAEKIVEMMESNSLDKAPTQSLLSVVNGILDESMERNNGEIPYRVACLLRKVVQEIGLRIVTQAEHLRMQSGLFKAREEKNKSRIQVLEAIAEAACEDSKILTKQLQQMKNEQAITKEKSKSEAQDVFRLMKEEIVFLKQELEVARKTCERRCLQMESKARSAQNHLEERMKEASNLLTESKKRIKELEMITESEVREWNKKEHIYHIFTEFQLGALQDLRLASQSIRQEVVKTQNIYAKEFDHLEGEVHALEDAARNYYDVLAENQKLHNVVQDLRGNIRVHCRIRPFLPEKEEKLSAIEYMGENGELVIINPSKTGKEASRLFKFNKVYGPSSTQDEVFSDIQPLVQSVLDGYNVCIFAYGQTGSGKTYTMMGPYGATEEQCGVNHRALNDLFHISQTRESTFTYEIGVQMVEIYNDQVRDLLSSSSSQKKYPLLLHFFGSRGFTST
ncbi:microtubule binding motor protein [Lithospermum erythrorhizon]|uniref:Microtubule binding motor protein n=1 Tax=Lithospermum erythrorhizon TaxID=34254 RepID=A0AAV3R1K1_LITER